MAREPQVIPFADAMPSDTFEIEDIGNNEVLVGDPSLDVVEETQSDFDENLAEQIDAKELVNIASDLITSYEAILSRFRSNVISASTSWTYIQKSLVGC